MLVQVVKGGSQSFGGLVAGVQGLGFEFPVQDLCIYIYISLSLSFSLLLFFVLEFSVSGLGFRA